MARGQLVRNVVALMDPELATVHSLEVPVLHAKRAGGSPSHVACGIGRQEIWRKRKLDGLRAT